MLKVALVNVAAMDVPVRLVSVFDGERDVDVADAAIWENDAATWVVNTAGAEVEKVWTKVEYSV